MALVLLQDAEALDLKSREGDATVAAMKAAILAGIDAGVL